MRTRLKKKKSWKEEKNKMAWVVRSKDGMLTTGFIKTKAKAKKEAKLWNKAAKKAGGKSKYVVRKAKRLKVPKGGFWKIKEEDKLKGGKV